MIGTTILYQVLATLWYQMKHELLLNKIHSLLWRNISPWQWANPVKTPFILSLAAYISQTNLVTPIFYFWKVIRRARQNFLQSLKKICLADSESPYLYDFVKVALNPLDIIFLNVCWTFHRGLLITFQLLKRGVNEFFFEIWVTNSKI